MAAEPQDFEPEKLTAGVTWKWKKTHSDYPASEWTLTYYLRKDGATATSFTGTADEDSFLVTVAASTTSSYAAGVYDFIGVVSRPPRSSSCSMACSRFLPIRLQLPLTIIQKNFKKPLTAGRFRLISTKPIGYR